MKKILSLFFIAFTISAQAQEYSIKLWGRSIADTCRYIYRIETDFKVIITSQIRPQLRYSLINRYTRKGGKAEVIELDYNEKKWQAQFTPITMSTNPKFLSHEMNLFIDEKVYTVNFSHLMNKCYPEGRSRSPFTALKLNLTDGQ